MNNSKLPSNKNFGITFFIFFAFLSFLFFKKYLFLLFFSLSIIFLVLGLLNSKILLPLNILWNKFGIFLGKIMSPIIMIIVYFGVVFPTKLILFLLKKDVLNVDFRPMNKKIITYWNLRKDNIKSMDNQF